MMRFFFVFTFIWTMSLPVLLADSVHVVQKNETLGGIAQRYGLPVSTLQAYNGITNPNLLYVGKN